jgi:hypothetical protein
MNLFLTFGDLYEGFSSQALKFFAEADFLLSRYVHIHNFGLILIFSSPRRLRMADSECLRRNRLKLYHPGLPDRRMPFQPP